MSAVYFAPNAIERTFSISKDRKKAVVFHSTWSSWYEECLDDGNEQIKIHIHHKGPYLLSNKFRLTLKVRAQYPKNVFSITKKVIMMDNLENPQVFTMNRPKNGVPVIDVFGHLCMLDAGCITSVQDHRQLYHDFSNSARPHDVVLNLSDRKLYCNKVVLALCFNYFDRLFFSETDCKDMKTYDLPELSSSIVQYLLNMCFSNQKEFPKKTEHLPIYWPVERLRTVYFLEMSDIMDLLKKHFAIDVGWLSKRADFESLMIVLELADKHNLPHVQAAAVRRFRERYDSEEKKKFVAEYENRLKQLKLKNLFNFLEKGFDFQTKKPGSTFAFSVDEEAAMYEKKVNNYKNVTLLIGDQQFKVHKEYLAFWSPYFDRLFFGDFAENGKNEIELKEIDPEEFSTLLKMIYPPRNVKIDDSNVFSILKLSDRLQMKEVITLCGNYLAESLQNKKSTMELMDLLEIADAHCLIDVQVVCFNRIKQMNPKESAKFRRENRVRLGKVSPRMTNNIVQAI